MDKTAFFDKITEKIPQTISIIGLAKNVGKTTTLNFLLNQVSGKENLTVGISSTGWDGESFDSITGKPKPKIILSKGNIAATTEECLKRCGKGWKLIEKTGMDTSMGKIMIIEVLQEDRFEIAGPTTISELAVIKEKLLGYGAELILFDGAINRKASSSKRISDSIIIATGLNAGYSLNEVKIITSLWTSIFELPVWDSFKIKTDIPYGKMLAISGKNHKETDKNTTEQFLRELEPAPEYLYIPGSFSDPLAEKLLAIEKIPAIILEDPSSIFLTPFIWGRFKKRKSRIFLLEKPSVKCITLNPTSSSGHKMESEAFFKEMESTCRYFDMWDIVSGKGKVFKNESKAEAR